jgi:excisionase family DNA binding protein
MSARVTEFAQALRVSDAHIYALLNEQSINAVRVGVVVWDKAYAGPPILGWL